MLILITLFFTIIFIYSENGIILTKIAVFWGVVFHIVDSVIDAEEDKGIFILLGLRCVCYRYLC